jgi:two-component system, NarL family, sensor histidine kinase DesK
MTSAVTDRPGDPPSVARQTRWLLAACHVPFIAIGPVYATVGIGPTASPAITVPVGLAIGALALRHAFAAARGDRPAGWQWTLAALAIGVYLPMYWLGFSWVVAQFLFIPSAAMLLRGWPRIALTAGPIAGSMAYQCVLIASGGGSPGVIAYGAVDTLLVFTLYCTVLVGAVRLALVTDELYAARAELAEAAVGRERLRVSRDLHDLLGQSLSAISLKGDLALRLLHRDVPRARAEVESLTEVARSTLRDLLAVTRGEHDVSVEDEIDAAEALLTAASIQVRVDVDTAGLPAATREVLAWAVREGTTNVLRHADARTCSIVLTPKDAGVRLEITNDGANGIPDRGSGLSGLAARAETLSGIVRAEPADDDNFQLCVWIPEETT